jgi:hypothetical protein
MYVYYECPERYLTEALLHIVTLGGTKPSHGYRGSFVASEGHRHESKEFVGLL